MMMLSPLEKKMTSYLSKGPFCNWRLALKHTFPGPTNIIEKYDIPTSLLSSHVYYPNERNSVLIYFG